MAHLNELDALYAFLAAAALTALLTPLTMRLAIRVGAVDEPRERGLSERPTPLLGGLAIFAGALVAGLIWLPAGYAREHQPQLWHGVLIAAALITLVGALDDRFDLPPIAKLAGQIAAAAVAEDADIVGISSLSGAHLPIAKQLLAAMSEAGLATPLIIGGTIPPGDVVALRRLGVAAVFPVGTPLPRVVEGVLRVAGSRTAA